MIKKLKEDAAVYGSSSFDLEKFSIEDLVDLLEDVEDMINIKKAKLDAREGRVISLEELKKRSQKWLKK